MVPVPGTVRSVDCVPTGAGVCALPGALTLASAMPARSAESNLFINVPLKSWTLLNGASIPRGIRHDVDQRKKNVWHGARSRVQKNFGYLIRHAGRHSISDESKCAGSTASEQALHVHLVKTACLALYATAEISSKGQIY